MRFTETATFLTAAKEHPSLTIAVAQAADTEIMQVIKHAKQQSLAEFILIGDQDQIQTLAVENGFDADAFRVIHAQDPAECAELAVKLVRNGDAALPMKGNMQTGTFLRAVLHKENGLPRSGLLSEITVTNKLDGSGLLFVTDCAMAISPTVTEKKAILENCVTLARRLGVEEPKVACLAAMEMVNVEMPETVDAAILSAMSRRGQIQHCQVDGPFALDNAISLESAQHKAVNSPVAGQADILLVSDIRMGNVLHKAITYFAGRRVAVAVAGASVPILMNSRSDFVEDKLLSIALACLCV